MKTSEIVHVYKTRVWVDGDMMGSKHVMMQHQAPGCEPFCYCSFHYNYAYTDNASIRRAAERMALTLGATEPVEFREREWIPLNALANRAMTGKLYVFGIPVVRGLYAANAKDVRTWRSRVPPLLRWACRFSWYMTWTTKEEYRDATGEVRRLDTKPCPKCGCTRLAGGTHCGNNGAPCYWLSESLPQNAKTVGPDAALSRQVPHE